MSKKLIWLFTLVVCCLSVACGRSAPQTNTSHAENVDVEPVPDEVRSLPGFSTDYVPDPVFGGRIYILEAGPKNAPPLVLVHGVGARGTADWYPVLKRLCANYRVLALDLPGFARSSRSDVAYGPATYVKAIRELTRQRIGRPFYLLGHSMGGAISLLYAGTYPDDVTRLVLADVAGVLHRQALVESYVGENGPSPSGPRGPLSGMKHAAKQNLKAMNLSPSRMVETDARTTLLNNHPQTVAALSLMEFNFGPAAGAIAAPTLLIWGKNDNVAPMRTAKALLANIKGANLTVLERSAHVPMTTEPEAFVSAVHGHFQPAEAMPPPSGPAAVSQGHGVCRNQTSVHFEGGYDTITIDRCREVTLSHVTASAVTIRGSTVAIEETIITGADVGLNAADSVLFLTGGRISGKTAIHADGVVFDMAGVHIVGNTRAVSETSSAQITCSICKVESPIMNKYVHDLISISKRDPFEK